MLKKIKGSHQQPLISWTHVSLSVKICMVLNIPSLFSRYWCPKTVTGEILLKKVLDLTVHPTESGAERMTVSEGCGEANIRKKDIILNNN